MTQLNHLFQPFNIGGVELKNRIVMLSMDTGYGDDWYASRRDRDYLVARARGGAGLIITGMLMPSSTGQPLPGRVSIHDDRFIPGLKQDVDAVHAAGAKIMPQIGLQYFWARGDGEKLEEVGPSDVATRRNSNPRPLAVDEIHRIIEEYAEGVHRALDAGFDGVELHCGIGYLIARFISPATNKRTDEYGGSFENRMRFLLEILESAKRKVGDDFSMICRFSADEFMPGGNGLEEGKKIAKALQDAGVHCLNVGAGWHECRTPLIYMSVPRGNFVYLAEEIKKTVDIPVIAAYRINDPVLADSIIADGKADLVGMGRALLADPELPNKAREGRYDDIRPCIACNHCLDCVMLGAAVQCSVNPLLGREAETAVEPARRAKKVFVIGGGPGGMQAAIEAAKLGHDVTLFERSNRLGGNLIPAAIPSHKGEIANLTAYLETQLKKSGVKIALGVEADESMIADEGPEAVIVAAGAEPIVPDFCDTDAPNVVTAIDVLNGVADTGDNIVVVGGGLVGCETAEYLADKGKKVTIVEMLDRMGNDIGLTIRWIVMQRLHNAGIKWFTSATVESIAGSRVRANKQCTTMFFDADTVVLAVGMKPRERLTGSLIEEFGEGIPIMSIGDCAEAGKIFQATRSGFDAARGL
ncbi:MAG: FAD-dependent oxidoreductase [Chloroflexota bacterium]|nr:FAD-dependent oxidoreductase [Chloroflexota bacterium]